MELCQKFEFQYTTHSLTSRRFMVEPTENMFRAQDVLWGKSEKTLSFSKILFIGYKCHFMHIKTLGDTLVKQADTFWYFISINTEDGGTNDNVALFFISSKTFETSRDCLVKPNCVFSTVMWSLCSFSMCPKHERHNHTQDPFEVNFTIVGVEIYVMT
jgi:hypothetical protein